jgi:PKD repeat protein
MRPNPARYVILALILAAIPLARMEALDVPIYPGSSIQAAVNANPAGTRFVLKAGTHRQQSVFPKDGTSLIGESGTVIDGENVAQSFVYIQYGIGPHPTNVTVDGLKIINYKPASQRGVIHGGSDYPAAYNASGWIVRNCEICNNGEVGLRIGHAMQVLNNKIHHNLKMGVSGTAVGARIEGNEIAYNNYLWTFDEGNEAGGTKFTNNDGLILRNNHVHHNNGPGLWMDTDNIRSLLEYNHVIDNATDGIVNEIGYSAVIRYNTITGNGWNDIHHARYSYLWNAAIGIHSSPDNEVYGNTISGNFCGIGVIQQLRGYSRNGLKHEPERYGPYIVQNLNVHDNVIVSTIPPKSGQECPAAGVVQDTGVDQAIFTTRNNRFVNNTYYLAAATLSQFAWNNGWRNDVAWRGYGQDTSGKFIRNNLAPSATITASPSSGVAPLSCAFTVGGSDPEGTPLTYAWTFGDGTTAAGASAHHVYATAGTYTASVTVRDSAGAAGITSRTISVAASVVNQPPTASIAVSSISGVAPLSCAFNANGSVDPEGSPLTYAWTFGDGATAAGISTSHVYASAGTYTARVTVRDSAGATASASKTITVTASVINQSPTASITATPSSGVAPLSCAFSASGSLDPEGTPLTYTWTFGDGATATGVSTNHVYASAGTYTARVTVRDSAGATASMSKTISVTTAIVVDNTPPAISARAASSVTAGAATITWTTNELSDSQVEFGQTTAYGRITPLKPPLVTGHSVRLRELASRTLYHYRVKSRDAAGNLAVSADATFTTLAATPLTASAVFKGTSAPGTAGRCGLGGSMVSLVLLACAAMAAARPRRNRRQ